MRKVILNILFCLLVSFFSIGVISTVSAQENDQPPPPPPPVYTPPSPSDAEKYEECVGDCEVHSPTDESCFCKCRGGIVLNTNIPFVGRCIEKQATASDGSKATLGNAFPRLIGGLVRIVMSAVVVVGLLAVLIGGFMVAAEGAAGTKQKGLELIKLAIGGLVLVGMSGIILNLINPNFFKTASLLLPFVGVL